MKAAVRVRLRAVASPIGIASSVFLVAVASYSVGIPSTAAARIVVGGYLSNAGIPVDVHFWAAAIVVVVGD